MEFDVVTVKPACDGAIVAVISDDKVPIILNEYKPVVDLRWDFVERHHLMEVLIQGYYCLYQHKVPTIIHCLTDLSQWYYFKVKPCKLKIAWYNSISEKELNLHTRLFSTFCHSAYATFFFVSV